MEAAIERHFYRHGKDDELRSFSTHKRLPVTIVNNTEDGATIPLDFKFINHSVFGPGVSPAEEEFRTGCECVDEDSCMYEGCHCLEEMNGSDDEDFGQLDDDEKEIYEWARSAQQTARSAGTRSRGSAPAARSDGRNGWPAGVVKSGASRKKQFAYHSKGAKAGLLRGYFQHSRDPIYECHEGCTCSKAWCPNRVVERGRKIPLQIFRTRDGRGWGVKTMAELKRGQFVDCYLGEVITPKEADRRRAASEFAQRKDVYLFALDKFSDPASMDPRLAGAPLEVDGEFMSGPTRFINHSCNPNLRIFARVGDRADKHIHDLAFFAIRDISKGEELTFDYVDGPEEMQANVNDEKMKGEMTACRCGSASCRGFLW